LRALKGTDLLVEAALRLFPSYPDATLLIIGRTTPAYAQFVAGLKARVAAAGLAERIIFMDEVSRDRIAYYFGLVSLYVAPMRYEGFGLTPLEAMACGAAVVATRTGAAAQLVADGETGVVVPPDDLDALTKAIESFLADPGKARSMGAKGHEKALAQHGLEAEAAAIQAVYESVLGFPLAQP
jgi:mannosyltransferase